MKGHMSKQLLSTFRPKLFGELDSLENRFRRVYWNYTDCTKLLNMEIFDLPVNQTFSEAVNLEITNARAVCEIAEKNGLAALLTHEYRPLLPQEYPVEGRV